VKKNDSLKKVLTFQNVALIAERENIDISRRNMKNGGKTRKIDFPEGKRLIPEKMVTYNSLRWPGETDRSR